MLDGVVVEQGMKLIFWRERPGVDDSRGHFFQSSAGADSSFPSSHSLIAWSAASALAGEYLFALDPICSLLGGNRRQPHPRDGPAALPL